MHCTSCGKEMASQAKFCAYCGAEVIGAKMEHNHSKPKESMIPSSLVGYSTKISDPAFDAYLSSSKKYGKQFTVGLVVLLIVGFGIYGTISDEMEFIQAVLIGSFLGGVYLTWSLIALSKKGKKEDWDGVVIDKKKKRKTRTQGSGDDTYTENYIQYQVIMKKNNGKKHTLKFDDTDIVYNYYQIGDNVRFHGKLNTIEKYDKSHDSIIFCNACATVNKIEDDVCFRCKCPLLK